MLPPYCGTAVVIEDVEKQKLLDEKMDGLVSAGKVGGSTYPFKNHYSALLFCIEFSHSSYIQEKVIIKNLRASPLLTFITHKIKNQWW